MRVTFQYQSIRYQAGIRQSLNDMLSASDKVQKGRLLLNPESSPSNYVMAYSIQRTLDDMDRFKKNAEYADGWLSNTDDAIQGIIDLIGKVRNDLALNGNNGYHSPESLNALAGDVLGIYNSLFDLANTKYQGHYLFSGFQTNTLPFVNKTNNVSAISQIYGRGGDVLAKEAYNDLQELKSGEYTAEITVKNDTGYLSLYDKYGNKMLLDSNGSDESAKSGNSVATTLSFKLEPDVIINTGRGISIKLPENVSGGLKYSFKYEAGSNATYQGDSGQIADKIGFNQDVITNIAGNELLLAVSKMLKGSQYNTVNGVSLTASSLFSQITGANSSTGDSIKVTGTDHTGVTVGAANVLGTERVNLNMLNASKDERTFTIGYAGKYYQVEVPAKGYKDMDELVAAINSGIKSAQYIGAQDLVNNYASTDAMEAIQNAEINGLTNIPAGTAYQVDLSSQIKVMSDGDRLRFVTTDTGNHTALSVTGYKHNSMGFDDKTVAAFGKDTIFEIGYDFAENGLNTIYTTHNNVDVSSGSAGFYINGRYVQVDGLNPANTIEQNELIFDKMLQQAGFGYTITTKLESAGPNSYNVTFTMQNVNLDRNTHLSTMYNNPLGTSDYQSGQVAASITPSQKEKTVGDFMNFVKSLYEDAVDVNIVDGRLVVTDQRTGASRMTMNITENNQGIGLPMVNQYSKVTGKYSGYNDDQWNVTVDMAHNTPSGTRDVHITVYDSRGVKIIEKDVNNYHGEEIELRYGVKLALDDMNVVPGATNTAVFQVDLKANASLNFGDMNVVTEGDNANAFDSLMNLYNAMASGFYLEGAGAPSAWRDESLSSTAIPYFDGTFTGNFNAKWKYEVKSDNGRSDFYVQNEFKQPSGALRFMPGLAANLNFEVQTYDKTTDTLVRRPVTVSLAGITNNDQMAEAIAKAINEDPAFYNEKIHATVENGKVLFASGSGTKTININTLNSETTYMMGVDTSLPVSQLGTSFTAAATFQVVTGLGMPFAVTIGPGTYANTAAVLADINFQLGGSGVTAGLSSEGKLTFNTTIPGDFCYYQEVVDPSGALGITNNTSNYASGGQKLPLTLSGATADQRTLTFTYNDGVSDRTASITLDAKDYNSYGELIEAVNGKLTAAGINNHFVAMSYGDGQLSFATPGISRFSIQGDNEGFLGFPKAGDKVTIAVSDEKGSSIQNVVVDTANKEYSVSDGLLLGFDRGSLKATDSFTGTIGSGIEYELGILDLVESQLLQCLTLTGNRQARVQSVIAFNASFKTIGENQKAVYLGSTDTDKVDATTQLSMAENAYKYALSITAQIMSISILDYLR